jgi:hypothetical protein
MTRKRKMREELLAHLVSIYEEEMQKVDNQQAALEEAKRRFGDPGELTTQLQQAVPRWDRWRSVLENMGYRPDERAWHLAAKHFLVMLMIYPAYLPLWLLAHGNLRHLKPVEVQYLVALLVGPVLLAALFNVILSIVLAPLLNKIGPVLVSKHRGRILLAVLCGFAVLCGIKLPLFAGVALLFILMARQAVKQWRYEVDWA